MKCKEIMPEDENQHPPMSTPLWREGYHFNGFDTQTMTGISISAGIRPAMSMKEEVVTIHGENVLLFLNMRQVPCEDALNQGLKMELLKPLQTWGLHMKDSFQILNNKTPSGTKDVELDLKFESDIPVYGYSTKRGDRYEQPGSLKGEITTDDDVIKIEANGIRDHSWEIRDISTWGEWYSFMGWIIPGAYCMFTYMKDTGVYTGGWLKTDSYEELESVMVCPYFSGDYLDECKTYIGTSRQQVGWKSKVISFVPLSLGKNDDATLVETVVQLNTGGYGFLWYGR